MTVALQLGGLTTGELLLVASDGLTVLLGLIIAYFAYLGYRRNRSRPMLFVAAGFVLLAGGPGAIFVVYLLAPGLDEFLVGAATQTSEVLGMLGILYGIAGAGADRVRS